MEVGHWSRDLKLGGIEQLSRVKQDLRDPRSPGWPEASLQTVLVEPLAWVSRGMGGARAERAEPALGSDPRSPASGSQGCSDKVPRLGSSTSRNVSARSFGGHKSKIKVLAGGFIPKAVEENLLQAPPWLGDASSPCVFLWSHLCARRCPKFPFLHGHHSDLITS